MGQFATVGLVLLWTTLQRQISLARGGCLLLLVLLRTRWLLKGMMCCARLMAVCRGEWCWVARGTSWCMAAGHTGRGRRRSQTKYWLLVTLQSLQAATNFILNTASEINTYEHSQTFLPPRPPFLFSFSLTVSNFIEQWLTAGRVRDTEVMTASLMMMTQGEVKSHMSIALLITRGQRAEELSQPSALQPIWDKITWYLRKKWKMPHGKWVSAMVKLCSSRCEGSWDGKGSDCSPCRVTAPAMPQLPAAGSPLSQGRQGAVNTALARGGNCSRACLRSQPTYQRIVSVAALLCLKLLQNCCCWNQAPSTASQCCDWCSPVSKVCNESSLWCPLFEQSTASKHSCYQAVRCSTKCPEAMLLGMSAAATGPSGKPSPSLHLAQSCLFKQIKSVVLDKGIAGMKWAVLLLRSVNGPVQLVLWKMGGWLHRFEQSSVRRWTPNLS